MAKKSEERLRARRDDLRREVESLEAASRNRNFTDWHRVQLQAKREELRLVEFVLSPPRGRRIEGVYAQALRDLQRKPRPTISNLAERYFPGYFPDRKDEAIAMLKQGLRRERKRTGFSEYPKVLYYPGGRGTTGHGTTVKNHKEEKAARAAGYVD